MVQFTYTQTVFHNSKLFLSIIFVRKCFKKSFEGFRLCDFVTTSENRIANVPPEDFDSTAG